MEADHRLAKNDFLVPLGTTMRMQFDEVPIGASTHLNASLEPRRQSMNVCRLVRLDAPIFGFWKHAPLATFPIENQRSLDQHQCVGGSGPLPHRKSSVVGFGPHRVIDRIINAVDCPSLCRVWCRWHGEIGIAAGLAENVELVIDAATAPVRSSVIKGPVAMNEGVDDLPGLLLTRKKTMGAPGAP